MWYQAYAGARAGDRRLKCVVCYSESRDGIHFDRPELDLFPYKDQKTNIVLVSNGGHGDRYGCSVLVDANDKDPARRYKMAYYDWSVGGKREEPGLHVAFSPDGIHWTKHNKGPLLPSLFGRAAVLPFADEEPYREVPVKGKPPRKTWSYPLTMSDVVDVFWDPIRQVYVIIDKFWIDGPDGGTAWKMALGRTESKDFLHWSKPQLVLAPDDEDGPDVEFHGAPAFFHQGRFFALCQVKSRRARLTTDIELMTSRDGLTWERPFRKEFFLAQQAGVVRQPDAPVQRDSGGPGRRDPLLLRCRQCRAARRGEVRARPAERGRHGFDPPGTASPGCVRWSRANNPPCPGRSKELGK